VREGREVAVGDVRDSVGDAGGTGAVVTELGDGSIVVRSSATDPEVVEQVRTGLAELKAVDSDDVTVTSVGASFGEQISRKALQGLIVFLVAVSVYISFRFEWKMAAAAIVALLHDLAITAGIYAATRLEVTPATVIAILTILGFSLYDTVVVFDKIRDNAAALESGVSKLTYAQMVNRSMNQVLMRSLNTSLTVLLPVGALLLAGIFIPAASTLRVFAVALFIGILSGTYSSVFLASPLLAWWKQREPRWRRHDERVRLAARADEAVAAETADVVAQRRVQTQVPVRPVRPSRARPERRK
jgi:preprotein translocase subunit SecF